ncbi:25141_t:CDS:1 [Racocetra persica]|uniref:25141_t:CDS:1 n=1 Tax=Racocetra persica TaxID=160502 RepID=A0ACA9S904_9GLOM|nr:25141_t:CDS:1 [Racocetra persica]
MKSVPKMKSQIQKIYYNDEKKSFTSDANTSTKTQLSATLSPNNNKIEILCDNENNPAT